ncbi:cytochrome C oxidase Cbb3 [Phenylobacterium sp. Root77]|jgi:cytochrome c oxidase cbb3-type subunit 3|uniref:cytochrome-c oxidase, cbb3-type subunit III n=1 Tax=unclassified Phenylobacterium TaxID=2640670 RepID=UPI0006F4D999|nr:MULTISPECIES: cytochrome-c oxidase, cbb3-type subunit III [unclassified Phenylobacterium]KQW71700.1 cytochrome C oxidase Cbb3 [Phenylobacterium sp. Root1277]KQW94620.1 cytochrome C oxidase Cbb3 [Phenylobacterium sp. Root1290]KRC44313.1 cytochrome C oxidase Cbb3 [Phenylobacterium sp. Root77]
MSKREADEVTGVETTGHEWDGIRELDNPLPRWWLYMFWAGVVVAIVYWVLMPAWPGARSYTQGILGQSDRADVAVALNDLKTVRGAQAARLKTASLEEIERDPELQAYAQAVGQSVFGDNCATCHGTGGVGAKGYANLRDDVWLWGGSLEDIHRTIEVGIRADHPQTRFSQMPAFGRDQMLSAVEISDLTEYVVALSGRPANAAAVRRAEPVYQAQCVACHGPAGVGDQKQGAPNLTDQEWLYGSTRADIHAQIWNGRAGVMPSWKNRFDPETLKALAVYIHANAGGQ